MTYQEALDMKSKYGDSIIKNGSEFLVLIAPKNFNDLIKFLSGYKENTYTDSVCKMYSTDNEFQIYVYMSEQSRRLRF